MSRIVETENENIRTHPASKEYRDNWDRIFGEKSGDDPGTREDEPLAPMPGATGGSGYTADEAVELLCRRCGRVLDQHGLCSEPSECEQLPNGMQRLA